MELCEANHSGRSLAALQLGAAVKLPGCGVYEFDPVNRKSLRPVSIFDVTHYSNRFHPTNLRCLQNLLLSWFRSTGHFKPREWPPV